MLGHFKQKPRLKLSDLMNSSFAHYQVLGIKPGASQAEIKQAYRDLALVWHPDRFVDNPRLQEKAEEKLKQINAAYEFLKSAQPQNPQVQVQTKQEQKEQTKPNVEVKQEPSFEIPQNYKKLQQLLQSGNLKDADLETKRLLLELARRTKEGWLRPEDITGLSQPPLVVIDQLWTHYSKGQFGFSVQCKIWQKFSSTLFFLDTTTQTLSENKFGQFLHWRVNSTWLSPWDTFDYSFQAPLGSLPREYIFTLVGWWSYSKGWTGYLLWRFDDLLLRFKD
jgi:hypothetical protein